MFHSIFLTASTVLSYSSLLTSPLAEISGGACALKQSIKKYNKSLI